MFYMFSVTGGCHHRHHRRTDDIRAFIIWLALRFAPASRCAGHNLMNNFRVQSKSKRGNNLLTCPWCLTNLTIKTTNSNRKKVFTVINQLVASYSLPYLVLLLCSLSRHKKWTPRKIFLHCIQHSSFITLQTRLNDLEPCYKSNNLPPSGYPPSEPLHHMYGLQCIHMKVHESLAS